MAWHGDDDAASELKADMAEQAPLSIAFNKQDRVIGELDTYVTQLQMRLEPALGPEEPRPISEEGTTVNASSTIVGVVNSTSRKIDGINKRLENVLSRLEI